MISLAEINFEKLLCKKNRKITNRNSLEMKGDGNRASAETLGSY